MTDEQAMGMWMGLFIGDAAGVPYEFMPPSGDGSYKFFSSGGAHNASVGEWSDDGAMALAIASAYISEREVLCIHYSEEFRQLAQAWHLRH
jgi:ADP-ribosyl-[dinitrogen reductase] hydrolase